MKVNIRNLISMPIIAMFTRFTGCSPEHYEHGKSERGSLGSLPLYK